MVDNTGRPHKENVAAAVAVDVSHMKHYSYIAQFKQASAGAISAFITRTITQPLDVLKIRFQLQVEPVKKIGAKQDLTGQAPTSKYTSMTQATHLILHEEGVKAFWKGHNAGQVMSITYGIVQFWSYEQVQYGLMQLPWLKHHGNITSFISGCIAGSLGTVFSMPFDVIRTRVVAQDHNAREGYRTIISAIPVIVRTEGFRGLFRGLGSTVLQIGPLVGANFAFYRSLNDLARQQLKPKDNMLPTWCLLLTGGVAGVASKSMVYPLDFIKKRLQLQGFEKQRQTFGANQGCTGMTHCIQLTLRHEGVLGFYKGMAPTLLKSGLTTALYFSIYDKFKQLLLHQSLE